MRAQIEGRPLVGLALGLIGGVLAAREPLAFLLVVGLVVWLRPPFLRVGVPLAAMLGFLRMLPLLPGPLVAPGAFVGEVEVISVPSSGSRGQMALVSAGTVRLQLFVNGPFDLSLGDRLTVVGRVTPPREGMEGWAQAAGISGTLGAHAEGLRQVRAGPVIFRIARDWRDGFLQLCQRSMSPRAAVFTGALCMNADQGLSPQDRDAMQRSGTTHIVSASGLHVFVLAGALQWMLALLPIRRGAQCLCLLAVLGFYAMAAGLEAPIVRSVFMASVLSVAYLVRREGDLLAALALAASSYLLFEPRSVHDIGFQLSFLTVGGLALAAGRTEFSPTLRKTILDGLRDAVRTSAVATVVSAPLVGFYFGAVSIISVLANLLVAAVLAPILVLALLAYALSGIAEPVSIGLLKLGVEPWVGWVMAVVEGLGGLSWAAIPFPAVAVGWIIAAYALLLGLWRWRPREA